MAKDYTTTLSDVDKMVRDIKYPPLNGGPTQDEITGMLEHLADIVFDLSTDMGCMVDHEDRAEELEDRAEELEDGINEAVEQLAYAIDSLAARLEAPEAAFSSVLRNNIKTHLNRLNDIRDELRRL